MDKDKQLEFLRKLQELKAKGIKSEDYTTPLESERNLVRGLPESPTPSTKISGSTPKIDTKQIASILSGEEFTDKISKLKALRAAGKKVAGVIPLAGVGMAALSGDPAMAAEEAASDLTGGIYDAIKSEDAGNRDEEREMLAERQALENYNKSPARLAKLKAMLWKDADVPEDMRIGRDLVQGEIQSADAKALSSDEIMPKMQDTLQEELEAAEQLTPEQMRLKRLQRLMGK